MDTAAREQKIEERLKRERERAVEEEVCVHGRHRVSSL